jgi:hypothetical protein
METLLQLIWSPDPGILLFKVITILFLLFLIIKWVFDKLRKVNSENKGTSLYRLILITIFILCVVILIPVGINLYEGDFDCLFHICINFP